jgi:hypothetical protein
MIRFSLRKKMGGVILEVEDSKSGNTVNEFVPHAEFDKLMEDTIKDRLLKLESRIRDEQ